MASAMDSIRRPGPPADDGTEHCANSGVATAIRRSIAAKDGKPIKYGLPEGPSEVLATPVIFGGRVYVAVGQEPEQGDGIGCLNCIDASRTGDISTSGLDLARPTKSAGRCRRSPSPTACFTSLSFPASIRCLDASRRDGALVSRHRGPHLGLHAGGGRKNFCGNESGILTILAAGREKKLIASIDMKDPIYSTPIAANGVLYVATQSQLYALEKKD